MSEIDLHIHSNASDGTDSPEEILKKIKSANIKIFTITDHDTVRGAEKLKGTPGFITGIEFSCKTKKDKCHILGLGIDTENKIFQNALKTGENLRYEKFFKRINFLNENFGINFSENEIENLKNIPSVGKPHIANLIVKKGLAETRVEAIEKYIDKCKTGVDKIEAEFAIHAILSSGGIPVWAHPLGGERDPELSKESFKKILNELISYGLKGLECYYSKYEFSKTEWLAEIANEKKLLVSGGSDYHGTNKNIPLGRLNSEDKYIPIEYLTVIKRDDKKNF